MKHLSSYLTPICLLAFFISCSEKDHFLTEQESVISNSSATEENAAQDRWIYKQMKDYYFWADQMKDSLDCDYSLAPDKFFKELLVEEDRFSFCYPNSDYVPYTKGIDLNETVRVDSIYFVGGRRVGYFYYSEFDTEADVTDVMLKFRGVDDLIVDVRNNPGGYVQTCIYLSSLIVPAEARGRVFCSYEYNSRRRRINMEQTGDEYAYAYFRDNALVANRSLSLDRVYVLTGPHSASCSELLINCLKPYMPVIVIGSVTTGKDVGMNVFSNRHCKYVLEPITFRTYNADGVSVPTTGIVPDFQYDPEKVSGRIGDVNETLLSKALEEIIKTNNIK